MTIQGWALVVGVVLICVGGTLLAGVYLPKKSRHLLLLTALALAAGAGSALLIPSSPAYLPDYCYWTGRFYDGHSASYWIKALNSSNIPIRWRALHSLAAIGPEAGEAVPALTRILLKDPSPGARIEASFALTRMSPHSRSAVPALAQALADQQPLVRINAITALISLRAESRPAIPALLKILHKERLRTPFGGFVGSIPEAAATALGWASSGSAEAVPDLTKALQTAQTEGMRIAAARALGEIGAVAQPALPYVRALLQDQDPRVREVAAEALKKITREPPRKVPTSQVRGPG